MHRRAERKRKAASPCMSVAAGGAWLTFARILMSCVRSRKGGLARQAQLLAARVYRPHRSLREYGLRQTSRSETVHLSRLPGFAPFMGDAGPHPWDQAARALESTWNHASTSFSHLQRGAADAIHGGMRRVAVHSRQHAQTLRAQLLARWAACIMTLLSRVATTSVCVPQHLCACCRDVHRLCMSFGSGHNV